MYPECIKYGKSTPERRANDDWDQKCLTVVVPADWEQQATKDVGRVALLPYLEDHPALGYVVNKLITMLSKSPK